MPTHRVELSSGLSLAVHETGSGPPLVLVHGILGCARTWERVVPRLSETHRVWVPELIGFGASSRSERLEDLWADGQAAALLEGLERLGCGPAAFVGHDFGGPTSVMVYRSAPERVTRLVLCATNLTHDTPLPPPLNTFVWPVVGGLLARLVLSKPSLRASLRRAVGEPRVTLPLHDYFGDARQTKAIQRIFAAAIRELEPRYRAVHETLPKIQVPTEVLWGGRDPFFDVAQGRRTAALIPGATFHVLEGCGHFVPEERPEALCERLGSG